MKHCALCRHAVWDRTLTGRLHPSGAGRCGFPVRIQKLPAAFWWASHAKPSVGGGYINRRQPLSEDCVYYERVKS